MTNTLAKQLGITLEPFCVKTELLTPQLAQDLLDRAVDLGAEAEECLKECLERKHTYKWGGYNFTEWGLVGVDGDYLTLLSDEGEDWAYNHNILSFPEMCDYLQVHQEGGRLVANEDLVEEDTNLWDTPSAQEVDEGGFTPWDGEGDLPFNIGEKVYVKLDSGEECMITHGGTRGNNLWLKGASGPTIVGYKSVPTYIAPVSPVERSSVFDSVEVGSNLERALELVLAVYNGGKVKTSSYGNTHLAKFKVTQTLEQLLSLGFHVEKYPKVYILESEYDCLNEEKEKLDKEIEELENKLQQCKDEREGMNNEG